jgi:proteasome component ECM29
MQIAVREAKRQNVVYRPHALKALAQVAEARRDIDLSDTVLEIVTPLIDDELQGDPMDVDHDAAKASHSLDV